jgi:hypothetical protein
MPQRDELAGLLASLGDLRESELLELGIEPTKEEAKALEHARNKAGQIAESNGSSEELERLQGEIVTWSRVGGARTAIWVPDLAVVGDVMLAELRGGAVRAIVDAATALFLEGHLDPTTRSTLLHRWENTPR